MRWIFVTHVLLISLSFGRCAWAEPVVSLIHDKDLGAWREPISGWEAGGDATLREGEPRKLTLKAGDGVILNGVEGHVPNVTSKQEFRDCTVHVEFLVSQGSNSGVYLMGRYEVQIYDSFGKKTDAYPGIECGGIYPRWIDNHNVEGHSPLVNASKPPGEWQTFDITFRAPRFDAVGKKTANAMFLKVLHNGQLIHENVELTGPTRGGAPEQEAPNGPILMQGDHGPVAFRNLTVTPAAPATAPSAEATPLK